MPVESILPTPDVFHARRVLCIQPHYDDNDIGSGGTLAALHDAGAELYYLTVTDDLVGVLDPTLADGETQQQLRSEQLLAGNIIGVREHFWLEYPDSGKYDYFDLRCHIVRLIRMLRPDFLFAPDPWLPYEAHHDHIMTGRAAAEAVLLYGLPRFHSDPHVDAAYQPHDLQGVAFYYTSEPNTAVNIADTWERKAQALHCYQTQFTPETMAQLLWLVENKQRAFGQSHDCALAEGLKVMHPSQLHCGI